MNQIDLTRYLIELEYLKTAAVIEAFKRIDRKDFVLPEYEDEAYGNYPLPIGFRQTISQPLTVAFMLELLGPQPGEKILEIGAGSGWQTALLAHIVSGGGALSPRKRSGLEAVAAIERIPELKEMATKNVSKYNFIEKGIVRITLGDGTKGCKERAPFDKVIAAASARGSIPVAWKEQLRVGGRIVAPVGGSVQVFEKIASNDFQMKEHIGFSFVPLIHDNGGQG